MSSVYSYGCYVSETRYVICNNTQLIAAIFDDIRSGNKVRPKGYKNATFFDSICKVGFSVGN